MKCCHFITPGHPAQAGVRRTAPYFITFAISIEKDLNFDTIYGRV
jgi:hypothetical protein